jgi:hypothetical protein
VELYAVKFFFSAERVFSRGAFISPITQGINSTYGGGAKFGVQPNTVIASPRSIRCTAVVILKLLYDDTVVQGELHGF